MNCVQRSFKIIYRETAGISKKNSKTLDSMLISKKNQFDFPKIETDYKILKYTIYEGIQSIKYLGKGNKTHCRIQNIIQRTLRNLVKIKIPIGFFFKSHLQFHSTEMR